MWFRIELHKDGGIASCVEVEGSFKDTRSVHYVEADTKEEAIAKLKKSYERRLQYWRDRKTENYRNAVAAGLCVSNGCKNKPAAGLRQCETCRAKRNAWQRDAYANARGRQTNNSRTSEHLAAAEQAYRDKHKAYKHKLHARHGGAANYLKWLTLTKIANKFDALGAERFRSWLQTEIDKHGPSALTETLMYQAKDVKVFVGRRSRRKKAA